MPTLTLYVGSPWSDDRDTLDKLYRMLATETLDPTFEEYGDFCMPAERAVIRSYNESEDPRRGDFGPLSEVASVHFFGNFYSYSCAFSVYTDEPDVIAKLRSAVLDNKATVAYKEARDARRAERAERLRREREVSDRIQSYTERVARSARDRR